jgi:hypothetical protein
MPLKPGDMVGIRLDRRKTAILAEAGARIWRVVKLYPYGGARLEDGLGATLYTEQENLFYVVPASSLRQVTP